MKFIILDFLNKITTNFSIQNLNSQSKFSLTQIVKLKVNCKSNRYYVIYF